ncbi:pyrroloquinoline quinone biosynthesis peptide chaperone PqqD [Caenispirillum bisanense]|uniref:Pyrroloquinoline quinone biosynthesis protein D n=1 Tax=Caenispirillum bisanense TaxID=414052 RepID=A0A286GDT8_9PROT|nr:pyrroloquinoline quinone biosynthesis peptide chaperone PqqD [Caenispirillum bisanense]SOD93671.1 pyrroloquinoline quinone biosynthesis protein D [Caenispirillum bisanense]
MLVSRTVVTPQSVPALAPHVTLRHDGVRDRWVVLGPERMLVPDEIAVEILKLCDGERSVAAVVARLAAEFDAAEADIAGDVTDLLQSLADKGFVRA